MWIQESTPSEATITFRADRVLAVKSAPGNGSDVFMVGRDEPIMVQTDAGILVERINEALDALASGRR